MSRWCLGCVLNASQLGPGGGFGRVLVVSWWSCRAAVAEITAKIGSNKKGETVLLGLYAGLILACIPNVTAATTTNVLVQHWCEKTKL